MIMSVSQHIKIKGKEPQQTKLDRWIVGASGEEVELEVEEEDKMKRELSRLPHSPPPPPQTRTQQQRCQESTTIEGFDFQFYKYTNSKKLKPNSLTQNIPLPCLSPQRTSWKHLISHKSIRMSLARVHRRNSFSHGRLRITSVP